MSSKVKVKSALNILLAHYRQQVRKHRTNFLLGAMLPGIGSIFVYYLPPLVLGHVSELYYKASLTTDAFVKSVIVFSFVWLLGELFWRLGMYFLSITEVDSSRELHKNSLKNLLEKDIDFFNDNYAGSLTKKSLVYASNFEQVCDKVSFNVFNSLISIVFAFIVLGRISLVVLLMVVAVLILSAFVSRYWTKKRMQIVIKRQKASNAQAGVLADIISNIFSVKSFGNEKKEMQKYNNAVDRHIDLKSQSWHFHNLRHDLSLSPLYVLINAIGYAGLGYVAVREGAGISVLIVGFAYLTRLTRVVWEVSPVYRDLEQAITDASEYTELLVEEPKVKDFPIEENFRVDNGEVKFDNISFVYQNNQKLFERFNLHIEPGERVGLVGKSGGGKTTITKLLLRFMDVSEGKITIDGFDISKVSQEVLRKSIGYVPQDTSLFHRSIKDNIAYGKQNASMIEIITAAKKAHAHKFIEKLENGYDTLVGERGVKLSGGQRQRIAIARAILKNAPILVLDEATSALDSESEVAIQDGLKTLMKDKTAIVIAHRLSTIAHLDRIIVLDEGRIIDQGSHNDLLKKKDGLYAKLWKHQSGGYLE